MIDRDERFVLHCISNDDFTAADLGEIKRVQRLADLEHDIIGRIDNVVDRLDTDGCQAILQPIRRRPDFYSLEQPRRVAKAVVRFNFDLAKVRD